MHSPGTAPFWGAQTSYLNFCEEDYVITRYIAEFINTLSSLVYAIYGIYGLWGLRGKPHARSRSIPFWGLMGVGICSAGYHMTLKYHTQMSDELSMHLLTTPIIYRILTFKKSAQHTNLVGAILLVLFTVVMVVHMVMDEFLLHATTFGTGVYLIATGILKLIRGVPNPILRSKLRNSALLGVFSFAFGYFVWLIDTWICGILIKTRHSVGLPFAFLLELHGWWHIFTAIGGYIAAEVVDVVTSDEVGEDRIERFAWPVPFASKLMGSSAKIEKQR